MYSHSVPHAAPYSAFIFGVRNLSLLGQFCQFLNHILCQFICLSFPFFIFFTWVNFASNEKREKENFWSNFPENIHVFHWTLHEWWELFIDSAWEVRKFRLEVCGCAANASTLELLVRKIPTGKAVALSSNHSKSFSFINLYFSTLKIIL